MRLLAAAAVLAVALAAGAAAQTEKPVLRITEKFVGAQFYIEGSIGYVRIRSKAGRLVASNTFAGGRRELRFKLRPGVYRLVSFQRPCDGNCGYLDPPTDRCSRLIRIRRMESLSVRIEISPGNGCTIRLA